MVEPGPRVLGIDVDDWPLVITTAVIIALLFAITRSPLMTLAIFVPGVIVAAISYALLQVAAVRLYRRIVIARFTARGQIISEDELASRLANGQGTVIHDYRSTPVPMTGCRLFKSPQQILSLVWWTDDDVYKAYPELTTEMLVGDYEVQTPNGTPAELDELAARRCAGSREIQRRYADAQRTIGTLVATKDPSSLWLRIPGDVYSTQKLTVMFDQHDARWWGCLF